MQIFLLFLRKSAFGFAYLPKKQYLCSHERKLVTNRQTIWEICDNHTDFYGCHGVFWRPKSDKLCAPVARDTPSGGATR